MANDRDDKKHFPTREEIIEFIGMSPTPVGKREIARAFNIKGAAKIELKKVLKDLNIGGDVVKGRRRFDKPDRLPPVDVLEITGIDDDGEVLAKPNVWKHDYEPPQITVKSIRRGGPSAPGVGDKILAKLRYTGKQTYEASIMKVLGSGPQRVLGLYRPNEREGRVVPTDRKDSGEIAVPLDDHPDLETGALVLTEILPGKHFGLRKGRITEVLGNINEPKSISLVSIHARGIPFEFPPEVELQARESKATPMDKRTDLRDIPLVTIDGADARDFDDAVWAEADTDPENEGGWHLMVAIADVSWYVRPGDALDREAVKRGNSCYFPDRVVPMLPFELSNGWCSLVPHEDRGCMAVEMWLDKNGHKLRHKFCRGMMRSAARLTYDQVQRAVDGQPDDTTGPLVDTVIKPLYGAFDAFLQARKRRGVLELDVPERKIELNEQGQIVAIAPRARFDSHKLIEELMIAANVCAAEELERIKQPCMYRIHDAPSEEKLEALREFLEGAGYTLNKAAVLRPRDFNQILEKAKDTPEAELINTVVLRSQSQAMYSPDNIGHFGLALNKYGHFTSPIRRYADLLVHRALIAGLKLGEGGLPPEEGERFEQIGADISGTERRAAMAERDAVDRYVAAYMSDKVGAEFPGKISSVTHFGLFISLQETGADGLVPISTLPDDYYVHDPANHALVGQNRGKTFRLGDQVVVRIADADAATGSLALRLAEHADITARDLEERPRSGRRGQQNRRGSPGDRSHRHGSKPGFRSGPRDAAGPGGTSATKSKGKGAAKPGGKKKTTPKKQRKMVASDRVARSNAKRGDKPQ
ncbi:ribonuclease R [Thalassospira lucentensis]|uniref:ribonuclease R n=1 Tax=Thalassospira lucentensis TaxID=168935 RepID=UPI0003B4731E|nr:ribonuclease R [Thalassospira lucentensis]RCK28564.1 RNAse R [Thalassospira lucentensis MCCC 1A00383 = DSM 14000]